MSQQSSLTVTHTSTVTPDQIDELGHMNVRWYGHNALAATEAMCAKLGLDAGSLISTYTRHHHEQMEGNQLEVRTALLGGSSRLRLYHELRNRADDDLAATFVHELDLPPIEAPTISLPDYGKSRSIELEGDRLASAPALTDVQARNLEIRLERQVTTEDTMGAETVPAWLANNLMWGGERPDGESDWIQETADGDRVGFATMESRLWIGRLPKLGTPIQSFGAVIALGEKISHDINWVYDLETEEVLAVMEGIDLSFSISHRRSRPISPEQREREMQRFHPDLAG